MAATAHQLGSADLRAALDFAAELAACHSDEEVGGQARQLPALVGSDAILIAELRRPPPGSMAPVAFETIEDPPGFLDRQAAEAFMRLWEQQPVVVHNFRGFSPRALRISDFLGDRQWQRSELYADCYRRLGFDWEIGAQIRLTAEVHTCVALQRSTRDFDERDRALLDAIGPHLRAGYARAAAGSRRDRRLALLERGLERRGDAVLLVDRRGLIVAGERGAGMLAEWLGAGGERSHLPEAVEAWRLAERGSPDPAPMDLRRSAGRLRLRLVAGAEEDAILLSERRAEPPSAELLARRLPISRREAEVLALLAQGHINASIAVELGLSPNTVGRYVERVYAKLDVHNRAAATAAVRDALDD